MERYLGKTREECFDADGWFHTGDIGHVDAEENIHWSGRNNEMIKTGGANVSPAEIEVALRAFPAVTLGARDRDARPAAGPDRRVVCRAPRRRTDHERRHHRFLRERIASYKVPKQIVYFPHRDHPVDSKRDQGR